MLGEYRRFLFLAMQAGHPVSPSRPVDLAWHQHLLDTRSYWQEFCPRVLGRPLHHTPSRGGARRSASVCGSGTAAR
ncbi:MAG: glycine-rich domain-containing protein [Cyanobacteriota bacterium]